MKDTWQLTVPRIRFGAGTFDDIAEVARPLGRRPLLVRGRGSLDRDGRMDRLLRRLTDGGLVPMVVQGGGEPTCAQVDDGAEQARRHGCDLVLAVGGGSILDLGKAIAGLAPNGPRVKPFLEEVGDGSKLVHAPLPLVAVPTTAGTGCEATVNAVIGNAAEGFKRSLRDPRLLPRDVLIDPALAMGTPRDITLAAGFDALTQLIESYTSRRITPPVADLCLPAIGRVAAALRRLRDGVDDLSTRGAMAHGALVSGIALAHVGLGAVHALASPLGGALDMPHAHVCARLLPIASDRNRKILAEGRGDVSALVRYEDIDRQIGEPLASFCGGFTFPSLSHYGLREDRLGAMAAGAGKGNLAANPADLRPDDLVALLRTAL